MEKYAITIIYKIKQIQTENTIKEISDSKISNNNTSQCTILVCMDQLVLYLSNFKEYEVIN